MYGQEWPAQSSNLIYEHIIKHCWLSVNDYETSYFASMHDCAATTESL